MALPPALSRLVALLGKLPGIGEKTALRLAFHVLRAPPSYAAELAEALSAVAQGVRLCSACCNITDADPCPICADARRDGSVVCVVASVPDLLAIERTGEYRGRYHVLHGVLSPLDGVGPEALKIDALLARLREGEIREVIVATNPDVEGEATGLYLHRLIGPLGVTVSRIAQGVPMGGDIEYADQVTLGRAIAARRPL
jgi:recombination protein RecR